MDISDKISKVDRNFIITRHDNGYTFEVSGRNLSEDGYTKIQLVCQSFEQLICYLNEYNLMEIDD